MTDKNSIKEKTITFLMIASVFVGIYIAFYSWLTMKSHEYQVRQQEIRIVQTEKLATEADRQYFIINKIVPMIRRICEDELINIEAIREHLLKKYQLDISIYKFDNNNKMVLTAPKRAPNQWLMRNLFPALIENNIEKIESMRKDLDKKVEFAFGYGKNLLSIKNCPEVVINTVASGKAGFVAWGKRANYGVIIVSNGLPDQGNILAESIAKMVKLPYQKGAGKIVAKPLSDEDKLATKVEKIFSKHSQNYGIIDNREWFIVKTKNQEKFYTNYLVSTNIYDRGFIYLKVLFAFLVPFSLFVIISLSQEKILSLKKLVTLIFLASSLLPLTILGTASLESVDAVANIHRNELKSSLEEAIGNIIQKFNNYKNHCSTLLNQLAQPPESGKFQNLKDYEDLAKRIVQRFPGAKVAIRDAASAIIYKNYPAYTSGQETLFKDVCHRLIEKYMPSRLNEKPYTGNPFTTTLLHKDDMGFNAICNYPNQLQFIKNGEAPLFFYCYIYPEEVGEIAMLEVQLNLTQTMKDYAKTIDQRSLVTNNQQINLVAYNPLKFRWSIGPSKFNKELLEQAKAAFVMDKPIFRRIAKGDNYIYSLCIPNSDFENICYLGSLVTNEFEKLVHKQRVFISIGAIVAIVLSICIISWLMKQIIAPLGNLEIGIKALAERKFEVKLPVPSGKDELTTLFKEFNFMMGESYDMQIAKNVQDGLITTQFPEIEGYHIAGISKAAGDLGGDCLSSFLMPDGKLLFLVGDLTGHSIGSALMMAFVRSITFNWTQRNEENVLSLAEAIDKTLRDNQMEKMFMGIVCGILNPTNGKITFVTKGHIFPLFLRNDGSLEWLGHRSLPLGIGKKQTMVQQESILLPGERLLCISDGIIEINKNGGMTTGYDLIEKWAEKSIKGENKGYLERIEAHFQDWCKKNKAEQTDDMTLFTIIANKQEGGSYFGI